MTSSKTPPPGSSHPPPETADKVTAESLKHVQVLPTPIGKGVFARHAYPEGSVIGEITGEVLDQNDPRASGDYCMSIGDEETLEPSAPFRFLNHCCDPNCEYDYWEEPDEWTGELRLHVVLISIREIQEKEQLTIDYNWGAYCAIPCACNSEHCRGWIVCAEERHLLP